MDPELEMFLRRPAKQLKLQHEAALDDTINCVATAATADGQTLVAVGQADTASIVIFDGNLTILRELAGHVGGTNSLAFASSSRLVSAGEDGTAAVWDPTTGDLLARLECEGENTDRYDPATVGKHGVLRQAEADAWCVVMRCTLEAAPCATQKMFWVVSDSMW